MRKFVLSLVALLGLAMSQSQAGGQLLVSNGCGAPAVGFSAFAVTPAVVAAPAVFQFQSFATPVVGFQTFAAPAVVATPFVGFSSFHSFGVVGLPRAAVVVRAPRVAFSSTVVRRGFFGGFSAVNRVFVR